MYEDIVSQPVAQRDDGIGYVIDYRSRQRSADIYSFSAVRRVAHQLFDKRHKRINAYVFSVLIFGSDVICKITVLLFIYVKLRLKRENALLPPFFHHEIYDHPNDYKRKYPKVESCDERAEQEKAQNVHDHIRDLVQERRVCIIHRMFGAILLFFDILFQPQIMIEVLFLVAHIKPHTV